MNYQLLIENIRNNKLLWTARIASMVIALGLFIAFANYYVVLHSVYINYILAADSGTITIQHNDPLSRLLINVYNSVGNGKLWITYVYACIPVLAVSLIALKWKFAGGITCIAVSVYYILIALSPYSAVHRPYSTSDYFINNIGIPGFTTGGNDPSAAGIAVFMAVFIPLLACGIIYVWLAKHPQNGLAKQPDEQNNVITKA
ncbi:MAG: hypothetical protein HN929_06145 [Chloroflexi bacterium]|jgi:hypothetical protein|nr:hypothetical protein [Chloroflexota bacterium]MBT7081030.1 hypothetical protein [Chloroflexota bacterium]MBT7289203.1 hypothetical protein [Chloroflexota bacterium]